MRLSTFSDYSLRVLIFLAVQPDGRGTIEEIAQSYGISRNHLMKVVQTLGRTSFVTTTRGRGGGLSLGRKPEAIRLGNVLRHTEGHAVVECLGNGPSTCPLDGVCNLTDMFAEAKEAFFAAMDRHTLADAVTRPDTLRGVLQA